MIDPSVPDAAAEARRLAVLSIELHHAGRFDAADEAMRESVRLAPPVHTPSPPDYVFTRTPWEQDPAADRSSGPLLNVLNFAWEASPERKPFGSYYAMPLGNGAVSGQRDPSARLRLLPAGLAGKSILDLGCNFGGMLFAVDAPVKWAVGADYDARLVNAANRIAAQRGLGHRFYVFNLETDPMELLRDLMPEPAVDVAFLLSVCAHIKNWPQVIAALARIARAVVFEANGLEHEQLGQQRQLCRCFGRVVLLADKGAPGIGPRRLYWCETRPGG